MVYPDITEFNKLASKGNCIPVVQTLLADCETPLSVYLKIRDEGESFLFESVEGGEHLGRYSFVGCRPRGIIRQVDDVVEFHQAGKIVETYRVTGFSNPDKGEVRDGLEVVEKVLSHYKTVPVHGLPRFTGGAVGFIGYEFIHDVEPVVPRPPKDELGTPTLHFLLADRLLIFDRVKQTITVLVNALFCEGQDPEAAYDKAVLEVKRLVEKLKCPAPRPLLSVPDHSPTIPFTSNIAKADFLDKVSQARDHITAGDIIQVVGSQRFSARVDVSPVEVYRAARLINPSPYMFLLELGDFSLVGASPEIHVRCEEGKVEIRPIAGTRPRGKSESEDIQNERDLLADPKERAEHVMLVDLARNDIGRVCTFGSVQVKDLMIIERYSHVMHIVSQVEGLLDNDKTTYDLMRATFPAGTLSGAPKVRAMQIIADMEQTARGPYGGCVGYFSFGGNLDCCITIRTALLKDGMVHVQAGGGWVHDSIPESEFMETVNKSRAMIKAVEMAGGLGRNGS